MTSPNAPLSIVVLGLSITSSWGNGHATTYRGLVRELAARGHDVLFLERDLPFYADNRDLPEPPYGRTDLYTSFDELTSRHREAVRNADVVIVGSYVPEGVRIGHWVCDTARGLRAFYDIDTPVTLAKLDRGDEEYVSRPLVGRYDLYLSFTGGPTLRTLERDYGAKAARALYCSVDPALYFPEPHFTNAAASASGLGSATGRLDLGYLGTYSEDRQPALERLLLAPARQWPEGRFAVVGPQYPAGIDWPANVQRAPHLPPSEHRAFYNAQRFTLNVTRADMVRAGHSPSVRLFEAAACGTPIISDRWAGIESIFTPNDEILIADSTESALRILRDTSEATRLAIGQRARARVLAEHTAAHRAESLERYVRELLDCAARERFRPHPTIAFNEGAKP
jgi:spore maturation protein CgeB